MYSFVINLVYCDGLSWLEIVVFRSLSMPLANDTTRISLALQKTVLLNILYYNYLCCYTNTLNWGSQTTEMCYVRYLECIIPTSNSQQTSDFGSQVTMVSL